MKFMLDTTICIYLIKLKPKKVLKHFQSHSVGDIGISSHYADGTPIRCGKEPTYRKKPASPG